MAQLCDSVNKIYQAKVLLRDPCDGLAALTEICCLDNFSVDVNRESLVNQKVGAAKCPVRRIDDITYTLNFELFKNFSINVLDVMLPGAETYTVVGTALTETISMPSGSWTSITNEDVSYTIPYGNEDGTAPTITVTGSVDGALVDGTDFEVTQVEGCAPFEAKYVENFLTIKQHAGFANTLTTLDQELTIVVSYTPKAGSGIRLRSGKVAVSPLDVIILGVNKADNTDIITIRSKVIFGLSGSVLLFDNGEQDLPAKSLTMEVEEDTIVDMFGLALAEDCGDTCA